MKKNKVTNIKLSACMIVKNEEAMLERCLNSIKHLVDEIIIVDTGSTDSTVEIAKSFNARIFHHPWEDDFSKHRNQSISYATGDWILVIDADEELDAASITKNRLKETLKKKSKNENALFITILEKNSAGEVTNKIKRARFFRNHADVIYRGIVHNTPEYKGSTGELELNLFHYGYALSEEKMLERHRRTSYLLHQRVEQNPDDYPAYFYLAQLCMQMNEEKKGIEYARKCLDLLENVKEKDENIHFYYSIYHILALTLISQEDYHTAIEIVREGLEKLPDEIDLLYDLACTGYFLNDLNLVIEGGEPFIRSVDQYKNRSSAKGSDSEEIIQVNSTRLASTTTSDAVSALEFWLMSAYIALKRFDDYEKILNRCQEQFLKNTEFHEPLLSALDRADGWDLLEKVIHALSNRQNTYSEESETTLLEYKIFLERKKEAYESLEAVITKFLELTTDYETMNLATLVIVAEYMLKINNGKSFIQITAIILNHYLEHELDSIKNTKKLALAYNMLAQQQESTIKGKITALACLDIAWILSDDQCYRNSIKELKNGGISRPENIAIKKTAKEPSKDSNSHSSTTCADEVKRTVLSESDSPACFRTSFGDFNITPKISDENPVFLQGIIGEERKATGVGSPLRMQLFLIEDESQTKILFVAADIFGFGSEMVEIIRNAALKWGIASERVILNASHTHYAPGTLSHTFRTMGPFFKEYAVEIAGIVGDSLSMLHDNLEESYIYSGKTDISVGVSSRLGRNGTIEFQPDETGSYDQHTPFLLFELQKSSKKIIMVNHGCQPTGLGIENSISADFPGYFREELINSGKVDHVIYLQGASGDIKEASTLNNRKVLCRTSQDAKKNGRLMAQSIEYALDNVPLKPLTESIISCTSQIMYLRLKKLPDINRINELKNDPLSDPVIREWASRLGATYPSGDFPNALALDLLVAVIGKSSTFICLPAGPVAELGISLKKITDYPESTFILGYTNGLLCYLPDDKSIERGGYESEISPYYYMIPYLIDKGMDSEVISTVNRCFSKVHSSISKKHEHQDSHENQDKHEQQYEIYHIPIKTYVSIKENSKHLNFINSNKILHGTYEIANQMYTITRGLRKLGFSADTVSYYPNYLKYKSDHVLDISAFPSLQEAHVETQKFANKLIEQYDIFHFHFSQTLTLDYSDLQRLQQLSKKRISHYWGSDVRMLSIAKKINPYVKVKQLDENVIKKQLEHQSKYISHAMVGDYELFEYVKNFHDVIHIVPAAIIIEDYPYVGTNSENKIPLLVHAPTSPEIKGSKYILKAIEDLKDKYRFDFKLIQNTSHEEAKKWYAKADLIIDELHCGTYGLLTIELMSMGKPVLTWISDYMREKYPKELPVISANPDNIKEKIEYMLKNRDIFPDLGKRGREYVEKNHDIKHVANQIMAIYKIL